MNSFKILKSVLILISISSFSILAQSKIEFSGETLENKKIVLTEVLKSGPALVNFWALWCKPCRSEMKHLDSIYSKYSNKGFTIIGINQDSPRSLAKVKSFVSSHKIDFPIITDPNQEIFQQFNGQSIPLNILFNKNGEAVYTHVGYLPGDEIELENEIKSLLGIKE
jgi:thiol-disulfide isomerase/thioredoxin